MSHGQSNYINFNPKKPIAVIGAGVMGTKVAWSCARVGIETRLYDIERGKAQLSADHACTWSVGKELKNIQNFLKTPESLQETLADVQLVHENVPEVLDTKQSVYKQLSTHLHFGAFISTNASAFTCSQLASATDRPDRFFNLNFSDPRFSKLVELMVSDLAAIETVKFAVEWAQAIKMVVVHTKKEQQGYIMNRIWRVIKKEVLRQIEDGYASAQDIDRAWMLAFGTRMGPCGLMDDVGLNSILSIEQVYYSQSGNDDDKPVNFLIKLVENGKLGSHSGSGFYTYPNPEYNDPDFITFDKKMNS